MTTVLGDSQIAEGTLVVAPKMEKFQNCIGRVVSVSDDRLLAWVNFEFPHYGVWKYPTRDLVLFDAAKQDAIKKIHTRYLNKSWISCEELGLIDWENRAWLKRIGLLLSQRLGLGSDIDPTVLNSMWTSWQALIPQKKEPCDSTETSVEMSSDTSAHQGNQQTKNLIATLESILSAALAVDNLALAQRAFDARVRVVLSECRRKPEVTNALEWLIGFPVSTDYIQIVKLHSEQSGIRDEKVLQACEEQLSLLKRTEPAEVPPPRVQPREWHPGTKALLPFDADWEAHKRRYGLD